MQVPLTISDFLERAANVYPDRIGVVDEPGVSGGLGSVSYRELGEPAWRQRSTISQYRWAGEWRS